MKMLIFYSVLALWVAFTAYHVWTAERRKKKEVDITNMVLKRCPYCTELFSLDVNTLVVRGSEASGGEQSVYERSGTLGVNNEESPANSKLPEPCKHLNIVPRDDLSYYCKDCEYDTFDIKKDEDGNLTHLLEKPKAEPEKLDNDPCGIEGKYEHWTHEELENECNVLISNMDAQNVLHLRENKELIEEFLRDLQWYIAFQTHYHWISWCCICKTNPIAFEKWMIKKWQGRLKN